MTGSNATKIIYWDACIYLAWLAGDEEHPPGCMDAIAQAADDNFKKKNVIVTSTLTFVEVLEAKLTAEQERQFRRSFRSTDHIARDVDPPVAMRAREFRQNLLDPASGKTLSTPDAIHLATASIYKAECWTFDDGKKSKKHFGLLELNNDLRVDELTICLPYSNQSQLFLKNT